MSLVLIATNPLARQSGPAIPRFLLLIRLAACRVQRQVERINENECQALADFVKNAHRQAGSAPSLSAANEIPTALLCTGLIGARDSAAKLRLPTRAVPITQFDAAVYVSHNFIRLY
jgi:hypothetical protein